MHLNNVKMFCRTILVIVFIVNNADSQDASYIRYFKTESDLMTGLEIKPTEARNSNHIETIFNDLDQLIAKMSIDEKNNTTSLETYEYREDGTLWRRAVSNEHGKVKRMIIHGDEEMSDAFISLVFPHRNRSDFAERTTVYHYNEADRVMKYQFFSVDHTAFGEIEYDYFEEGLVKKENWRDLLSNKIVRSFHYWFNPISREYTMVEKDAFGKEVSRVGLTLPRALLTSGMSDANDGEVMGNRLEESAQIIEDIVIKKAEGWDPTQALGRLADPDLFLSPDFIYMKSGDTLEVNLIALTQDYVRFILSGELDVMTIPLRRISEIERRDGEVIYPVVYR